VAADCNNPYTAVGNRRPTRIESHIEALTFTWSIAMRTALILSLFLAVPVWAAEPTEAELIEKAKKLNKDATNEDAANKILKELTKDKPAAAKLTKVAAKMLADGKKDEKVFRFYPALVMAKAAHAAKEWDAAEAFYAHCVDAAVNDLKSHKMITLACTAQIDYFFARKQYDKAIAACEKFLDREDDETNAGEAMYVLEKKLRAMVKADKADDALTEINRFVKRFKNVFGYRLIKASVQREAGKYDDAVDTYKEIIEAIEENDRIDDDQKKEFTRSFRYSLSGLYSEMDKLDKCTEELEQLMKEDPDNPTYKNDLGFMWADHDMKLEEAEKLIRQAVEQDLANNKKYLERGLIDEARAKKANPAYTDSLGWVLYKRGKYEEALKHLLESAGADDEESDHIEIWDHVGDCYLKLGKNKEALAAFEKGLTMEDLTKKDATRRKNVEAKITKLKAELK
jgi:tetratricopeptide (TPR) repeat protein